MLDTAAITFLLSLGSGFIDVSLGFHPAEQTSSGSLEHTAVPARQEKLLHCMTWIEQSQLDQEFKQLQRGDIPLRD